MPLMIVPTELQSALTSAEGPIQMCLPDGKVVGFFTPAKNVQIDLGISEEELDARYAKGGGRKLDEILKDLEARG